MSEQHTPLVVVFPRGQLTPKDKERMTKAGIIAVEADDPKAVCQLQLTQPLTSTLITGDAIVRSALSAMASRPSWTSSNFITEAGHVKHEFVRLLSEAIGPSA